MSRCTAVSLTKALLLILCMTLIPFFAAFTDAFFLDVENSEVRILFLERDISRCRLDYICICNQIASWDLTLETKAKSFNENLGSVLQQHN